MRVGVRRILMPTDILLGHLLQLLGMSMFSLALYPLTSDMYVQLLEVFSIKYIKTITTCEIMKAV
jgi:hypothetical protein